MKKKYIVVPMYIRLKEAELLPLLTRLGIKLNRTRSDLMRIAVKDLLIKHGLLDEQADSSQ